MKKILSLLIFSFFSIVMFSQNASKVIYSNALTHCYVTAVTINDTTILYDVSEKSERKIWRITDRSETQNMGLMSKDDVTKLFETTIDIFDNQKVGYTTEISKNVTLSFVKIWGIKCVKIENTLIGVSFNINKKTAQGALKAINQFN